MTRIVKAMTVAAVSAVATLAALPAMAQTKVEAGQLVCKGGAGVGLILASKKTYACSFKPIGKGPTHGYRGTITKVGLDLGITGETTLVWTVLAASADLKPGSLAGNYAGVAANASVAVGGGANVLVGGSKNQITLQPLSIQGQTGVNIAVGIAGFALRSN
jgi:hypothetical protein